jgi:membrane protein
MPRAISSRWGRAPTPLKKPLQIVGRTLALYSADGCGTHAAAIAYYAIFSLIPLSLVILSVLGLVINEDRIVNFVFDEVPLQESQFTNVQAVVHQARNFSVAGISFGAVLLIWSSSGIFAAVRRGLNAAEHRRGSRPYWRGKLIDLAMIPFFGALIMLSIVLTAATQGLIEEAGTIDGLHVDPNAALRIASYLLPASISFVMFTLLYRFVPSGRPRWGEAFAGAAFATVLFELAKNIGALVFAHLQFTRNTAIYAGFGTVLAFLFWMFINASILLLGAEFARAVAGEPDEPPEPEPGPEAPPGVTVRADSRLF